MVDDILSRMFSKQLELQSKIQTPLFGSQDYINAMTLALIEELIEAKRETNSKPWSKKYGLPLTSIQQQKFKEELIDAWHFMINLSLAAGLTPEEIELMYNEKNKINHDRQKEGY